MKIVFSGGGTGGHIYPALALLKEIRRQDPRSLFLYIGAEKGLEQEVVSQVGIPFHPIEIKGLKSQLTLENLKVIQLFLQATFDAKKILKEFQPDLVVGTGGPICGPVVYAAHHLGIPTILHEQNVIPGVSNRFLAHYVDRIAISFEGTQQYFPKQRVVLTGNPRSSEVVASQHLEGDDPLQLSIPEERKLILMMGGSKGAPPINEAALKMIPSMGTRPDLHFLLQTGVENYATVTRVIAEESLTLPSNLTIVPYIYPMPQLLGRTACMVNRAGSTTLAEITALGIPSILIPSTAGVHHDQEQNALWMEEAGASIMILEPHLTGILLFDTILQIMNNQKTIVEMRKGAKKLGIPDASQRFYKEMLALLRSREL